MTHSTSIIDDVDSAELFNANVPRIDLVGKSANGRPFILLKQEDGPNLLDADSVRALLKEAEEPNMKSTKETPADKVEKDTDQVEKTEATEQEATEVVKTEPTVDEVAKDEAPAAAVAADEPKDVEKADGVDDLVAEPSGPDAAMANDPGSPAWEKVDAETAQNLLSTALRLQAAIEYLAGREAQELVSGNADADDASNAYELDDAALSINYAIDTLAGFQAREEVSAEMGEEIEAIGKALADPGINELATLEALGMVVKAGRVLSGANEKALESARDSISKVLASLPQAPEVAEVAKTEEQPDEVAKDAEDAPVVDEVEKAQPSTVVVNVTSGMSPEDIAAAVTKAVTDLETVEEIAKADPMVAVYNQSGKLLGAVKPAAITELSDGGAGEDKPADAAPADATPPAAAPAAPAPAPAAPAAPVAKAEQDEKADEPLTKSDVEALIKERVDAKAAESAATIATLEGQVEMLKAKAPSRVMLAGQTPTAAMLRGQATDAAATQATDVTKAEDLRKAFDNAKTPAEREAVAKTMNEAALAALSASRGHGAAPARV